ncbi:HNH endonuclease [Scleromatobacter humisilvae]|uniref:HNH endonuclease n=1 Tax=Scleromatobacter humisilvae TaxID=2897159 RepID=A0A9X1YJA3_9BURK|nr:HNH endonuclease [Scleromatobacter humisilvae]MCK9687344.1 HNH endonuclease [Scleromatobacter humisilvae]
MSPLQRLRIEKAAADCGFEMTPVDHDGGLKLRSARFPESLLVCLRDEDSFDISTTTAALLDGVDGAGAVTVHGWGALYDVLRQAAAHARTLPNRVADAFRRGTAGLPKTTEAERVVVQRVGQNLFRAALLDYWQGRCSVTGLEVSELLRASHIKPWAACDSDDERLDVFNGLLLAPHVDALFDGGWISFADDGRVLIAGALNNDSRTRLSVQAQWCVSPLRTEHRAYLEFHRQHEFRGAD